MVSTVNPIDPTENVKALVAANERFQAQLRDTDINHNRELREAETRRVDQLAAQRQFYSNKIAEILRTNQQSTADTLAAQVKEVKADLQVELRGLNQFRYESSGKGQGLSTMWAGIISVISVIIAVIMAVLAISRSPNVPNDVGRITEETRRNDLTLGRVAEENRRLIENLERRLQQKQ